MSAQTKQNINQERLIKIIRRPHLSEKSTRIAEKTKQFAFKVLGDATKPEIKNAVELIFNVKVEKVRIVNVKGKTRSFRQKAGQRQDWKKAYVALQEGYDIDFMGAK